jgi:hypothetical protein
MRGVDDEFEVKLGRRERQKAGGEPVRVPGGGKDSANSDRASGFTGTSHAYAQRAVHARQIVINLRIVRIKASDLHCRF